jgi:hypothetical protein
MIIFRATLRLHGEQPPTDYERLTTAVAERARFAPEPFLRVVRHLRGTERISPNDADSVLAGYLAGAQQLAAHIDRLGTP